MVSILEFLILSPAGWLFLALVLVLVEIGIGGMVAMPLGVAAGIMAVLLKLHVEELFISEVIDLSNWKLVLIAYACFALATIYVLRRIFNKSDEKEDINYY